MNTSKFKSIPVPSSEITPEWLYLSRRKFIRLAATLGVSAALAACRPSPITAPAATAEPFKVDSAKSTDTATPSEPFFPQENLPKLDTSLADDQLNTFEQITNYNNYYEFTTDKEMVAPMAKNFPASPWQVEVTGLVHKPKTFGLEDLLKFPHEERVYRLRCVEAWSMVVPWIGFPLSALLKEVEPTGDAQYVRFETIFAPEEMPGQKSPWFPWPYQEGLRLDEAMHNLTILATGLYGKPMPNQNGAPVRLVVPWKYGFKSIKAIVKIELVEEQPATLWSTVAPDEYGFYANVNPDVPHPRWSQASERRIGELGRRPTLMFNGYAEEVASLYSGMDLSVYY